MYDRQSAIQQRPHLQGRDGEGAKRASPRVLIADDDPAIRLLMEETLSAAGFEVSGAESGVDAIELCNRMQPDLVLLDINMPAMDGITACARIREATTLDVPIIMVTSVDDAVSIQSAFEAGATDFILKPINWPLFQRRLETVLHEWDTAREVNANKQRVRLLEKVVPEQVMLVARNGDIIEDLKNRGEPADLPRHQTLDDLYGPETASRFKQRISGVLKTGRHNDLEFAVDGLTGARNLSAQFLAEGRERVIVVVQDAGSNDATQSKIFDLAFIDAATGLPNQNLFDRWAKEKLANARLKSNPLSIMTLGFDNPALLEQWDAPFIQEVGDQLNQAVARVPGAARIEFGESAAHVARIDPSRFMLIFDKTFDADELHATCEHLAQGIADKLSDDSKSMTCSTHFGIASFPADGQDLQSLTLASDTAMHEALATGRLYCRHSKAGQDPAPDFEDYGEELRRAIEKDELELFFQPRHSMSDGSITCVEALLRWQHPMRGFVDLVEVLHLAKASGLIVKLGSWVLTRACEAACSWDGTAPPRVAVNLSQQEFARHDLSDLVNEVLQRTELDPTRLELELTEAALLRSRDEHSELQALKALGIGLVLDNFGTGHTSLAQLRHYPIDALKIDNSFVQNLPGNDKDAAVCEMIVTMARLLGMKAVAEGVETEAQLGFLRDLGCDEYQGYHACKPLPSDAIGEYLAAPHNTARK
ncbi:MAG: GGDEF domain-containing response regulator [Chromatiales bacterium]|nr:MAG: GGDEF domain-containing response regulator [Chromatiales bacterium]